MTEYENVETAIGCHVVLQWYEGEGQGSGDGELSWGSV